MSTETPGVLTFRCLSRLGPRCLCERARSSARRGVRNEWPHALDSKVHREPPHAGRTGWFPGTRLFRGEGIVLPPA